MKVKIEIPQDYSAITVEQFQQLNAVWEKGKEPHWRAVQGVVILCGVQSDVAQRLTIGTLNTVYEKLQWLMDSKDKPFPLQPIMELNGKRYGMIPDFTRLSLGEFVDLEAHAKSGFFESLHKVMAVLFRPITDSMKDHYEIQAYNPSPIKDKAMLQAPMSVALGAMVFFLNIGQRLAVDSHSYLTAQDQENRP